MLPPLRRFVTLFTLLLVVAATVAVTGGAGCQHTQVSRAHRSSALLEQAQTFSDALRWQRFTTCGRMVAPEISGAFRAQIVDAGETLQITDGEILAIDWPEDSETATVRVRFRWVQLPSIVEQVATIEQRWEDRTNRGWTLAKMESSAQTVTPFDVL